MLHRISFIDNSHGMQEERWQGQEINNMIDLRKNVTVIFVGGQIPGHAVNTVTNTAVSVFVIYSPE